VLEVLLRPHEADPAPLLDVLKLRSIGVRVPVGEFVKTMTKPVAMVKTGRTTKTRTTSPATEATRSRMRSSLKADRDAARK
jgi:hypothetical protein